MIKQKRIPLIILKWSIYITVVAYIFFATYSMFVVFRPELQTILIHNIIKTTIIYIVIAGSLVSFICSIMLPLNKLSNKEQQENQPRRVVSFFLFSLAISFVIIIVFMNLVSTTIGRRTEQAWQRNFSEALLDGYTSFKGHYVNVDIAAYIFSYNYSNSAKDAEEAFIELKEQLTPEFYVFSESPDELVLRQPISYSTDGGFNEYRFMIDSESKILTVMYANLDSQTELKQHEKLIEHLRTIHQAHR